MEIIGKLYEPYDNSFCINCRNGKSALLVQLDNGFTPDREERGATFIIMCKPYDEDVYFCGVRTYTFVNVKSSNTGNIYRTLFNEKSVI